MRAVIRVLGVAAVWLAIAGCDDGDGGAEAANDAGAAGDGATPEDAGGSDAALGGDASSRLDGALGDAAIHGDSAPGLDAAADAAIDSAVDPDAVPPPPLPVDEVRALVGPWVDAGWLRSASIALVRGDQVAFIGLGQRSPEAPVAPDADTLYEIGSISKTFTGLLLADAVESGAVGLEDPVASLLPEGVRVPSRDGIEISLGHLVTHHSGLPRDADNAPGMAEPDRFFADYTPALLYEFLASVELSRAPGAAFEYSNVGAGLLGHALTLLNAQAYDDLLRQRVTGPLDMPSTRVALSAADADRVAPPFHDDGTPAAPIELGPLAGAGAVRSSARDMATYVRAYLAPERSALTRALRRSVERQAVIAPGFAIAYHWILEDGRRLRWHNGATYGSVAWVGFSPIDDLGVVLLANTSCYMGDALANATVAVLRGRDPGLAGPPVVVELPAERLAALAGRYRSGLGSLLDVTVDGGRLYGQVQGQAQRFALFSESPTVFHLRAVEARVIFDEAEDGTITGLFLEQGGRTRWARID